MQQNIQLRTINFKIFIISVIIFIPLLILIIYLSDKLSYNPVYFILFSLIAMVGYLIRLEQKSTKYFSLNFKENELSIKGKENKTLLYSEILNFNLYSLPPQKKLGFILRIKQKEDNFYFWITTKNKAMKWSGDDYANTALLKNSLKQKVIKKQIFSDYVIYGIALIPTVLLLFAFLFVLIVLFSLFTGNTDWFQYLEYIN